MYQRPPLYLAENTQTKALIQIPVSFDRGTHYSALTRLLVIAGQKDTGSYHVPVAFWPGHAVEK